MLMARLKVLERDTIAQQREAIIYLERRVEELMRMRNRIQRALGTSERELRGALVEVLKGWPST